MPEYTRPSTEGDYDKNFAPLKPLMNQTEAYYESSRCLFCYDAPCATACPTGIDIPLFIRQINTGNGDGAAKTIFESNHLGNVCAKVCPTEVLCEGACVYNLQNVKPIEIGRLQNFATDPIVKEGKVLFDIAPKNGKKVAVIGAGPAGLACAAELSLLGYQADVFEAKDRPSGLAAHGVAPYKITDKEVLDEVAYLQKQFGFDIKYGNAITDKSRIAEIESLYDAGFIGVGLGKTASLGLPGENLENCMGATEFIEELRSQKNALKTEFKRVVVIGGGNTAMDAASECARMGAESVYLVYRGEKEKMGAYTFEYELAKAAGVRGVFNASPKEIISKNGKAVGVRFLKTDAKTSDVDSEFTIECDFVIRATGQAKQKGFANLIDGLQTDAKGKITVSEAFQSSNLFYFAGGDAVNGGAEVVNAVQEGRDAARGIHLYLSNLNK